MLHREWWESSAASENDFENLNDVQEQQEGVGDAEGDDEDVQLLRLQLREVSLTSSSCMCNFGEGEALVEVKLWWTGETLVVVWVDFLLHDNGCGGIILLY